MVISEHSSVSETLRHISQVVQKETTIGDFCRLLGDRSIGLMLLIFALPNTLPIPVPGISTITSLPLLFFAAQLTLGHQTLWLPHWLRDRPISTQKMMLVVAKTLPYIERIEKVIRPRWHQCASKHAERWTGGVIVILAAMLALPIPLGNLLPGLAIALLALAIVTKDGLLMLIGWVAAVIAAGFVLMLISGYAWLLWRAVMGIL
jgi:hypothetical protein